MAADSSDRSPVQKLGDSTPFRPLRARQDDSWVEVASQPSSSSLSSINDEGTDSATRTRQRARRRRQLRPGAPPHLNISHTSSIHAGATSSQEEYDESESESDRVMTSSGEGPHNPLARAVNDEDDESRTAINYPIRRNTDACFTPQPNAFSRPLSTGQGRVNAAPGSYFPATSSAPRPAARHSFTDYPSRSHMPHNILSPSYDAAAHHDEALRASLTTLLSCAAAARGLVKPEHKKAEPTVLQPTRSNRVEPSSFRLVPESALPARSPPQLHEPTFPPTIRRATSASTSASSERTKENKRKALIGRSSSRERRLKKARRLSAASSSASSGDEVTPTLLTWVVSAGVVVFLGALSFTAGYTIGKEAGRLEGGMPMFEQVTAADESVQLCAREAGSLGLKRSLARSAVQV